MAYSVRLSNAIHVLVSITRAGHRGEAISSGEIAKRLKANPSQVRQMMGKLRKAGLISTSRGSLDTHMAREPWDISLLDIYRAVEGDVPLLHMSKDIDDSPVSEDVQTAIGHAFDRVTWAADNEMSAIKLEDIMRDYYEMENARPKPEEHQEAEPQLDQSWQPEGSDQGWQSAGNEQGLQGQDQQPQQDWQNNDQQQGWQQDNQQGWQPNDQQPWEG